MLVAAYSFNYPDKLKMSFEKESKFKFNTNVPEDYLSQTIDEEKLNTLLNKLYKEEFETENKNLKNLSDKVNYHKKKFEIKKDDYKKKFSYLIEEVMGIFNSEIDTLKYSNLKIQYYDDPNSSVEASCEPIGDSTSLMSVNLSRPISYDKAQQLASHELTHHVQFVLTEKMFINFPEMKIIQDSMPFSMLLEGGAELAVDLIYTDVIRAASLSKVVSLSEDKIKTILEIERLTWGESWPKIINLSKSFINNEISKDQLIEDLEIKCFKPHNSWPNADFIQSYRTYIQSYGWGKELIRRYLEKQGKLNLKGYIEFMKKPLTPSNIMSLLK